MATHYQVLYKPNIWLHTKNDTTLISNSDIVSISIINNYDTMVFPIFRIRLYTDLSLYQMIMESPNELIIEGYLDGSLTVADEVAEENQRIADSASSISFHLNAFIETKNAPSSKFDQYRDGVKISTILNETPKVPIELYGYENQLVTLLKRKCYSVYKNMSVQAVIEDILTRIGFTGTLPNALTGLAIHQQNLFPQILIPNLNLTQSITYLDTFYGLYEKGTNFFIDFMGGISTSNIINNVDCNAYEKIVPIKILGTDTNETMGGLHKYSSTNYTMTIMQNNISILSETDLQRILNAPNIGAVNVSTGEIQIASLTQELYDGKYGLEPIPDVLHKYVNPYIATRKTARIKEKMTRVDISAVGFDITDLRVTTRFNLIFDSAIRGRDMSGLYRPVFINHVFSRTDTENFIANTTMQLCSN